MDTNDEHFSLLVKLGINNTVIMNAKIEIICFLSYYWDVNNPGDIDLIIFLLSPRK